MPLRTDVCVTGVKLFLIPVETRMPLKFGAETLNEVTCARAQVTVRDRTGRTSTGWGETPISVQWTWPSELSYGERHDCLLGLCKLVAQAWVGFGGWGHPMELGSAFLAESLPSIRERLNRERNAEPVPYLASLVVASVFDQAIHDAYGQLHQIDVYETYNEHFMARDLAHYLEPASGVSNPFTGKFPEVFLKNQPSNQLPVWHLVGGLDPLSPADLDERQPDDGYPTLLEDWIERDGLKCLKVKLRGTDLAWDFDRLARIGQISLKHGVDSLSADFNCTVRDPQYVNEILDRLAIDQPDIFARILYVEQPFPYELEKYSIDVHSVSRRKPLFLDESAHDWRCVRRGLELGWSGVALKTCKTQTGALLSLCWAKAHDMPLMVQDLTNPMLAQIPHVRLAAHAGTIMGVESNAMQFYPDASGPEQTVHPGLYRRRNGMLDLSTIAGFGFGYRIDEIERVLGEPVFDEAG